MRKKGGKPYILFATMSERGQGREQLFSRLSSSPQIGMLGILFLGPLCRSWSLLIVGMGVEGGGVFLHYADEGGSRHNQNPKLAAKSRSAIKEVL